MGRLVYIVQIDGDKYTKQVLKRQTYVSSVLPFKRGEILDSNGTVLAHSVLKYKLILEPKLLLENADCITATKKALKDTFGIEEDQVNNILEEKPDSLYVIVKKNLDYDTVQAFKEGEGKSEDVVGVWFEEQYVREYPYSTLACDVIGFSNSENTGFYGLEEYYNDELNGTNGREYGYYDSSLDIDRIVEEAVNGNSIITSINADVQRIIQEKIIEFNEEYGSKNIYILVMDPNNGEIIAMASNQEYDLNSRGSLEGIYTDEQLAGMTDEEKTQALNLLWKNDVISNNFEPGSTFKPITVAAALEENLVSDSTTFYCDGGEMKDGKHIACAHVHHDITLGGAIIYSCNDALMQIAEREGKTLFRDYITHFGIGQKTGIDLPGEEAGQILSLEDLGESGLATSSFGQSTSITMIQMAAAFCSIINGGNYYQPHVVKKIVNDSGATVKEIDKILVRKTISEQTSQLLLSYLYQTVEVGTAQGAKVEGYTIGGKTGTAEKTPRGTDARVVSFIGCSPAVDPEMMLYVVIDEPQNVVKQTATLATVLAGEIFNEILPVLGIYPDGDIDYLIPTVTPIPEAEQAAQGDNNTTQNNGLGFLEE
jgi:stage V sporulation protein D (sporulation-specific penicillin-binding protein)